MNRRLSPAVLVLFSWCLAALTSANSPGGVQADRRDTRKGSVDRDDVLKRFVDELVRIAPGSDDFPESVTVASSSVTLRPTTSLRICRYETTQELYKVVTGQDPSRWKGPRNSVENVSRQDAGQFCSRLTEILRERGLMAATDVVRLPTDVEWEYCCRAGSGEPFCFGNLNDSPELLDQYAWHTGNAAGNDPAVGVLLPNAYGLYDVHGYLWEYVDVDLGNKDAPKVAWTMGGSWRDPARMLVSDNRKAMPLTSKSDAVGFRCVVAGQSPQKKKLPDR